MAAFPPLTRLFPALPPPEDGAAPHSLPSQHVGSPPAEHGAGCSSRAVGGVAAAGSEWGDDSDRIDEGFEADGSGGRRSGGGGGDRQGDDKTPPHLLGSQPSAARLAALAHRCKRYNIANAAHLFAYTELQLSEMLDASIDHTRRFLDEVAARTAPRCVTAAGMLTARRKKESSFLPTHVPALDAALRGGVPSGSITEFVGRSGNGKTQMCLTLVTHALVAPVASGTPAAVVYIDTENKFSATRLAEIASTRFQQVFRVGMAPDGAAHLTALMRSVLVFREQSSQSLARRLAVLDDVIIEHNVTLVVVDSIASLARKDFGPSEIVARQHLLSEIASTLKTIADTHDVPVVATNQVTGTERSDMAAAGALGDGASAAGVDGLAPTLGNTWAHCVNTRIVMETPGKVGAGAGIGIGTGAGAGAGAGAAAGDVGSTPDPSAPLVRQVRVLKSPIAPPVRVPYAITASGIEALQLPGCSF